MIEALLAQNMHKTIVTLNANIVGVFGSTVSSGTSMHVGHIKSIGIATDKKGKHALLITSEYRTFLNGEVDDQALDKVKAWITEVQRAMQSVAL